MKIKILATISFFLAYLSVINAQSYKYPDIPDSIVGREIRISYMLQHYWDNADFSDATMLYDSKVILDYLYLLSNASSEEKGESMKYTIDVMVAKNANFGVWLFGLEMYLHNPNSQFHDDELYMQTIDIIISSNADDVFKDALMKTKEVMSRNKIGSVAENFSYQCKDGKKHNMHDIKANLLLVMFNNPDCSRCQRTEEKINGNRHIQKMIKKKKLTVLAVCPIAEYDKWLAHSYPANWICGYDIDETISTKMLYEIRQFPSLYLLDKDKKVLLKESNYEDIVKYLFGNVDN